MNQKIIFLELNEVNFNLLKKYKKKLPNFSYLLDTYKLIETQSENDLKYVEPWILWPTIHSGSNFAEHKLFNLNDYYKLNKLQIWEILRSKKINIAAISPMNAKDNFDENSIYLPDPWSKNKAKGGFLIEFFRDTCSYFVNNNAGKKNILKYFNLLICFIFFARFRNYFSYIKFFFKSISKKWYQTIFFDLLLFDFSNKFLNKKYEFVSIFLNGAAHIQHHYLFNSKENVSNIKNPDWYIDKNSDPIFDIYKSYDKKIGEILKHVDLNNNRLIILTALSQDLVTSENFYYRLKDHYKFFEKLNFNGFKIDTLMSRDFKFIVNSNNNYENYKNKLSKIEIENESIFNISIEDNYLFLQLIYKKEINPNTVINYENYKLNAHEFFDLVAIKNGTHNQKGYLIDTNNEFSNNFPLKNVMNLIIEHYK